MNLPIRLFPIISFSSSMPVVGFFPFTFLHHSDLEAEYSIIVMLIIVALQSVSTKSEVISVFNCLQAMPNHEHLLTIAVTG